MVRMNSGTSVDGDPQAALLGDLVRSRTSTDRRALHRRVTATLEAINARLDPVSALHITAGDEYQGRFATVGQAVAASLLVRLALLPKVDTRHGIGWGAVTELSHHPLVEDGPAWWVARDAIVAVEDGEQRAALRGVRTAYAVADGSEGPDPAAVNAALMTRDQLVSRLSPRSLSVLRGLLAGHTQGEVAEQLGISASAVSQRVRADGLMVLLGAHERLGEVR